MSSRAGKFSFHIYRRPPSSSLFPYTTLFRSTLLPTYYQAGGFGGAPAGPGQRRFLNSDDEILAMIATLRGRHGGDRKSTRLNSSHPSISYAVFCLKKKKTH